LVDEAVHSEHGKVIQSDFEPGSVERSIDLESDTSIFFLKGFIIAPRKISIRNSSGGRTYSKLRKKYIYLYYWG
jgi:hypothetical protein